MNGNGRCKFRVSNIYIYSGTSSNWFEYQIQPIGYGYPDWLNRKPVQIFFNFGSFRFRFSGRFGFGFRLITHAQNPLLTHDPISDDPLNTSKNDNIFKILLTNKLVISYTLMKFSLCHLRKWNNGNRKLQKLLIWQH